MQTILENGRDKYSFDTQLILSPQSEIREFRKYLNRGGYSTVREEMLKEDGQFYLIIECFRDRTKNDDISYGSENAADMKEKSDCLMNDLDDEVCLRFGRQLLEKQNLALKEYLERERRVSLGVLEKVRLVNKKDYVVLKRINQLETDIKCIDAALRYYE